MDRYYLCTKLYDFFSFLTVYKLIPSLLICFDLPPQNLPPPNHIHSSPVIILRSSCHIFILRFELMQKIYIFGRTSQETHYISATDLSRLMLFWIQVIMVVTMKNVVSWDIKTQFVLHRRHITSPLQSPAS
jgi:hypothetical protein